jgi:hypothetical protein
MLILLILALCAGSAVIRATYRLAVFQRQRWHGKRKLRLHIKTIQTWRAA